MAEPLGFYGIVEFMKNIGFFNFYLPFVILFALLYGLLEKSGIFGEGGRRFNIIISLASALFILAYTPVGITLTEFFASFFTQAAVVLVTVLCFMLIIFLMVPGIGKAEFGKAGKYIGFFVGLIVIGMFVSSGGLKILFPGFEDISTALPALGLSPQDIVVIVLIVVTILIIYWMTKSEKPEKEKKYIKVPLE